MIENGVNVDDLFLKKVKFMQNELNKIIKLIPEVKIICDDAKKYKK